MSKFVLLIFYSYFITVSLAQNGFAYQVTGGGSESPIYPSSLDELVNLLTDNSPRVIHIDKEFNFIGSMGRKTAIGCRPASNTCPKNGGQDAINPPFNWCGDLPKVEVNYDVSSASFIQVTSDKTLRGIGAGAVIRGRALQLVGDNIIIQNIHFTDLNPQYIWGGDSIAVYGTDLLWVDHCKFSLIGRQFFYTDGAARGGGRITLSDNEFDGQTPYSATCNGHHYWAIYITGTNYHVTFYHNYIHHTSGRGPKLGLEGSANDFVFHAANNYYYDVAGHAFDSIVNDGFSLIEGNYFENVEIPRLHEATQQAYSPIDVNSECHSILERDCKPNELLNSGTLRGDTTLGIPKYNGYEYRVLASDAILAKDYVVSNAGVGKI